MSRIYYNIDESEYTYETENMIFYFSSLLYMSKFKEKLNENREDLTYKLSSRWNIKVMFLDYFDIILYSTIEKRGFKIKCKNSGVVYKCLNDIQLVGTITKLVSCKKQ